MKEKFIVTVYNTKTQSSKAVESTAETLGELKADFDNVGIDYSGMTFMEGSTKIEFKDDSSILPTNVPVKKNGSLTGETTNNIAIFLTAPNKKIASGSVSNRKEAYEFLKAHPVLADKFKAKFRRNYTNGSTESLLAFINAPEKKPVKKVETANSDRVEKYLDELLEGGYITADIKNGIVDILDGKEAPAVLKGYSSSDIDEMYGDGGWLK